MSDWTLCDCPHCGNTLRIDASSADEWARCPACRRHARIPDLQASLAETPADSSPQPAVGTPGFAWAGAPFPPAPPASAPAAAERKAAETGEVGTGYANEGAWPEEETSTGTFDPAYDEESDFGAGARQAGESRRGSADGFEEDDDEEPYELDFREIGEDDPDAEADEEPEDGVGAPRSGGCGG